MKITDLDTPVVTVDLDVVERNILAMQTYCDDHALAFRPHIKTHKLPLLAHLQMRAGAVGIACQKLGEAETMAAAGLREIMITFPLVGEAKAQRLAALASIAHVSAVCDSAHAVTSLSAVLERAGVQVDFLVEGDTGYRRTGVQTAEEAADLAELVAAQPGMRFAGLMTYPTGPESAQWLAAARKAIEARGMQVERVSAGGTESARRTHEVGEITEIRAGVYIYGDRTCLTEGSMTAGDCALRVRATVVSRPTRDRAILDAGSKSLTSDLAPGFSGYGGLEEYPEAVIYDLSEEHGHVDVGRCPRGPEVGEVVTILPNHVCPISNLFDTVALHRKSVVSAIVPVAARGKVV